MTPDQSLDLLLRLLSPTPDPVGLDVQSAIRDVRDGLTERIDLLIARGHWLEQEARLEQDLRFLQGQLDAGNARIAMLIQAQPEIRATAHFRPFLIPPDEGGSAKR